MFIGGCIGAAAVLGVGQVVSWHLHSDINSLVKQCETESAGTSGKLVCEPDTLVEIGSTTGIQAQIADAQQAINLKVSRITEWSVVAAIIVAAGGAAPFLWYFFLARVRELRDTIAGK
jgi:hypothetical protein